MRALIKQYVASLRERRELDAILPDLLSELGFHVYSRPGIGTRQFGVDVAAVGPDEYGIKKVFLFSIKAGDLSRGDWDDTNQGLRKSLNEITDHYIKTYIPPRYRTLPIVICATFGGDVDENVRPLLNGFIEDQITRYSGRGVSYDEWDGDRLTDYIIRAFLSEELMPRDLRGHLRKAVAMVDEPDSAILHFSELLKSIASLTPNKPKAKLTAVRQVNICLWILYAWAVDTGNLDAAQRAGALACLSIWELSKDDLGKNTKLSKAFNAAVVLVLNTQATISSSYFAKLKAAAQTFHGLGVLVHSASSVDINIKLFDFIGRLAIHGLWLHLFWLRTEDKNSDLGRQARSRVCEVRDMLMSALENNPALNTPLMDDQAIDINLACLLLQALDEEEMVTHWIGQVARASVFAFVTHDRYPSRLSSYRELLKHPSKRTTEYREKITPASLLFPTLAVWAAINSDTITSKFLGEFAEEYLGHCNMQVLFPDQDTEAALFLYETKPHGLILNTLNITRDGVEPLKQIVEEIEEYNFLPELSATKFGLYPLVLMACRHHQIPPPPQFWLQFVGKGVESVAA